MTAEEIACSVRRIVIEQSKRAHVGHIGSSLSIADIVGALFAGPLADVRPANPDRDRLVLSKGHAVLALYAALHACGRLDEATLDTFCGDGTLLGGHPESSLRDIDFSTGSLGHGLPLGAGAALAARLQGSTRRAFVVMSDAELNEGSVWEAAMFAAHHGLANLVAVIDANGQQALGYTPDILGLEPMAQRWESFGWHTQEVDGHDAGALLGTINELDFTGDRPHVLIARTTFGKGVSFMERKIEWHYLPMSADQHRDALAELARSSA
jgi:transketolase